MEQPITREEQFLAKAAGEDVQTPEPITRAEQYLAKIAEGGGQVDPEEIKQDVEDWLEDNIDPETGYVIDNTLSIANAAADAKAVGDELADVKSAISNIPVVTPEMYGAKGDGITDDTEAVQLAVNGGKAVYGKGTYLIGSNISESYQHAVTISNDNTVIIGKFIDGRTYSTTMNQKDYGAFLIDADNVTLDIEITNANELPVDDEDSNNLSDVGGYAVTLADGVKRAVVNVDCKHMNGVYGLGTFTGCSINVTAETAAYPYAANGAIDSNICIRADKCHRAYWGASDSCSIKIYAKNYYSTGDSSHVLLCATEVSGAVYHAKNTNIEIVDTGSTDYNEGAAYISVFNDIEKNSYVSLFVTITGDISNSDNSVFISSVSGSGSAIIGHMMLLNNMTINMAQSGTSNASRLYSGIDAKIIDAQYSKVIIDYSDTATRISLCGLSSADGAVYVSSLNGNSEVNIENFYAVVAPSAAISGIGAYQFFTVSNVFQFDPADFYRCTVGNQTKYLNGNVVT